MRSVLKVVLPLVSLLFTSSAFAVEPAPGQAAAAPPSASPIAITATCTLGDRTGVDEADAKTAADIVCHELAKRGATNTSHELRFGKLGGHTLVTLASRQGNEYNEVRTSINGMDEMEVAGPRLVSSLIENKTMAETRTVDNVMTSEQQNTTKQVGGSVMANMGMFGMSSLGESSAASAGFDVGIGYRARHFGITADGRAGGIGSGSTKLGSASLDVGGRLYITDGDIAPFIGGGFAVSYFQRNASANAQQREMKGSGASSFVTLGVEALRAHHIGLVVAARIDLPFYELEGDRLPDLTTLTGPYGAKYTTTTGDRTQVSSYVAPISLNVGLVFH